MRVLPFWFAVLFLSSFILPAEEFCLDSELSGWKRIPRGGGIFFDSVEQLSGGSVRLSDGAHLERLVPIEAGASYELTFYVKGESLSKVGNEGARIMICGSDRKKWERAVSREDGEPETGTFDWQYGVFRFDSAKFGTDSLYITLAVSGSGTVWYDRIELKKTQDDQRKSFRKTFGNPALRSFAFYGEGIEGFFSPNEPIDLKLELQGQGNADCQIRLKRYGDNQVLETAAAQLVLPGTADLHFQGLPQGFYIAEAAVSIDGKPACEVQCGVAVTAEYGERDTYWQFGFGAFPECAPVYKRLGVGSISLKLFYDHILKFEPAVGARRIRDYYDPFFKDHDYQLSVCFPSSIQKAWRKPEDIAAGKPLLNDEFIDRAREYAREFAKLTKDDVREWIIQSEIPSNATIAAKYANTWTEAMFNQLIIGRVVSRVVRSVDPGIKIWIGGNNIQKYTNDIERIVMTDLVNDFDGYVIDAYTGNWDLRLGSVFPPEKSLVSFYEEASALAADLGKSPLVRNEETGYAINYGAAYDQGMAITLAEYNTRVMILSRTSPVHSFEIFKPTDWWFDSANAKDEDRLMHAVWKPVAAKGGNKQVPLPGGAAYATATHMLSFVKCCERIVYGDFYAGIFERKDGKTVAALWNISKQLDLQFPLEQDATLVSMLGFETDYTAGAADFAISPSPVYLVTDESPEVISARIKELFENAEPFLRTAAMDADKGETLVFVRNLLPAPVTAEIRRDGALLKAFTLKPESVESARVPAGGALEVISRGVSFPVAVEAKPLAVEKLAAVPQFDGTGAWTAALTKQELRYPLDVYPPDALQGERGYFKTDYSPNAHTYSADYWLAYDEENIYIALAADDPTHMQPNTDSRLWEGDALQFAFARNADLRPAAIRASDSPELFSPAHNFILALTPEGVKCNDYADKVMPCNFPMQITRQGDQTFYEIAVPWQAIGASAEEASDLRFCLLAFDRNSPAIKEAPYWFATSKGLAGDPQDACLFRRLELKK